MWAERLPQLLGSVTSCGVKVLPQRSLRPPIGAAGTLPAGTEATPVTSPQRRTLCGRGMRMPQNPVTATHTGDEAILTMTEIEEENKVMFQTPDPVVTNRDNSFICGKHKLSLAVRSPPLFRPRGVAERRRL